MDAPKGFATEKLTAKLVYTCDKSRSQKFLAKPSKPWDVYVDPSGNLGLVAIDACLIEISNSSPELYDLSDDMDFTVYSVDYFEAGTPLLGHGRLSRLIGGPAQFLSGRIHRSPIYDRMVEVELCLVPIPIRRTVPNYMHSQSAHARRECSAPALSSSYTSSEELSSVDTMTYGHGLSDMPPFLVSQQPLSEVPPSSPPPAHQGLSGSIIEHRRRKPASLGQTALYSTHVFGPLLDIKHSPQLGASPTCVRKANLQLSLSDIVTATRTPQSPQDAAEGSDTSSHPKFPAVVLHKDARGALVDAKCTNCGAIRTSTWRKVTLETGIEVVLCNACGLWTRSKKTMRPMARWAKQKRLHPENWPPEKDCAQPEQAVEKTDNVSLSYGSSPSLCDSPHFQSDPGPITEYSEDTPPQSPCSTHSSPRAVMVDRFKSDRVTLKEISGNKATLKCKPAAEDTGQKSTGDGLDNKENEHQLDVAALLFTPQKCTDQLGHGSGSMRRWMSRYIHNHGGEEDVFEAFLQSPCKRLNSNEFDKHVDQLHAEMTSSIISSSPPATASSFFDYDCDERDDIGHSRWDILQSPTSLRKRTKLV